MRVWPFKRRPTRTRWLLHAISTLLVLHLIAFALTVFYFAYIGRGLMFGIFGFNFLLLALVAWLHWRGQQER